MYYKDCRESLINIRINAKNLKLKHFHHLSPRKRECRLSYQCVNLFSFNLLMFVECKIYTYKKHACTAVNKPYILYMLLIKINIICSFETLFFCYISSVICNKIYIFCNQLPFNIYCPYECIV